MLVGAWRCLGVEVQVLARLILGRFSLENGVLVGVGCLGDESLERAEGLGVKMC